jgi:hypothetical protein
MHMLTVVPQRYQNLKVDDEDGHYIVVPDAELTSQCELSL